MLQHATRACGKNFDRARRATVLGMGLLGDIERARGPSAGQNAAACERNYPALHSAVRPFLAELRGRQHEPPPSCLPLLQDQPSRNIQ